MPTKSYWQRYQRARITRRRLLGAAAAGAAGAALIACTDDNGGGNGDTTPGASDGSETPVAGGLYKEATSVISDATFGLDPHLSIAAGLAYFARMYNMLLNRSAVDPNYYLYDLCNDGGLEMPDETTRIFNLRPGVMIPPNGLGVPERQMDAEDCVVTFQRINETPLANSCQFVCQYFASSEATDPMTYRVNLNTPYAWFEYNIGRAISTIPPRELIQNDPSVMRTAGVGGGSFYIDQGDFVEGERVSMTPNPVYYRAGYPLFGAWDVVIIADRPGLRAAFLSQDSYTYGAASDAEVDELTSQHDVYKSSDDPTYTFIGFTMNVTRPPWDDPLIRKAAMHAINRQEYIDIVYQGAAQANGLVHWPVSGALDAAELEELQPFDPERSRQLIREATGEDTVDISVMFPTSPIQEHELHLPIFLEQMAAAGFNVQQDVRDLGGWLNEYRNKNYECSLALNQIYETAEIPLDFQHSRGPAGSDIYHNGLQDPTIDAAIDATKQITDFDELVASIQDVQRQIYEVGPSFFPFVTPFSRTLYWNFVKDVPSGLGTTGLFLTHEMWLDQ
jgi:peptide/nickel transport system substrate-binding protein